jgi:hypothetical protein
MQTVEKWLWRIRWAGRWTTIRIHWTEEDIRRENPKATRIEGSCIVVELPETEAEIMRRSDPPGGGGSCPGHFDDLCRDSSPTAGAGAGGVISA